jgi:predicted transcriptional regulator
MGQWLIDIGADKALGVIVIVASLYFAVKMYLISLRDDDSSVLGKRARDEDGRFIADDPSTEANEAYYGGKKPRKSLKSKKKVD